MMKTLTALVTALFVLVPGVLAISTPDVTFIPGNISRNSDFILQADPHASADESIRVLWRVGGVENGFGLFPRTGDKWFCYFSDTDPMSSCGPVPFENPGQETVLIDVTSSSGDNYNSTIDVVVGGIELRKEISVQGNNVVMHVWPFSSSVNSVSYEVYSSALEKISGKQGSLDYDPDLGKYIGTLTLPDGEYFVSFEADGTDDYGGTVARVLVGESSSGTPYNVVIEHGPWRPVINSGQEKELTLYSITNHEDINLTGLRTVVPGNLKPYLDVGIPETIESGSKEYYTLKIHGIVSPMTINSAVDLYFNDSGTDRKLGEIPVEIYVSVINASGGGDFCDSAPSGTFCNGGVCCSKECIVGGECCSDKDCDAGEVCNQDNLCVASPETDTCSEGTCRQSCRTGEVSTGENCTKGDVSGVCCSEYNECDGKSDGTICSEGVCCYGDCVECCTDSDCPPGEKCSLSNTCVAKPKECTAGKCRESCRTGEAPTGEKCDYVSSEDGICCAPASGFDPTLIIVAVAAVAGLVVVYFLIKSGKLNTLLRRGGGEEEGDEELNEEDFF